MSNNNNADFKFSRDSKRINWGATLWYNVLRGMLAGAGWAVVIVMFLLYATSGETGFSIMSAMWLLMQLLVGLPIIGVLVLFFGIVPAFFVISIVETVGREGKLVGLLFRIVLSLAYVPGDLLAFVLQRFLPKAVPVKQPLSCLFLLIVWVLN